MTLEAIIGLLSHSLALLADAAHMVSDAAALAIALAATWFAARPATRTKTFGFYRTEILAAFLNGLALWLAVIAIVYGAIQRIGNPLDVRAPMMFTTSVVGLVANLACSRILKSSRGSGLNFQSAYLHVLADTASSVSVIGAAVVIWLTGWNFADPIASLIICASILFSSWTLISQSVNILLEGVPVHIDVAELMRAMQEIPGVQRVHDIHVWTITSGIEAMSGHVVVQGFDQSQELLSRLNAFLGKRFGIHHVTLQLETE
ncbi:MAG: cation transporter [Candidatus Omnitrophica bacterium]|nr:cation transporter [Candidatus Omnitrophota bacterium]